MTNGTWFFGSFCVFGCVGKKNKDINRETSFLESTAMLVVLVGGQSQHFAENHDKHMVVQQEKLAQDQDFHWEPYSNPFPKPLYLLIC